MVRSCSAKLLPRRTSIMVVPRRFVAANRRALATNSN
jgi:hypothetical protein